MIQAMIDQGDMPVGMMVSGDVHDPSTAAADDAPFPDPTYKAGPLIMPQRRSRPRFPAPRVKTEGDRTSRPLLAGVKGPELAKVIVDFITDNPN